MLHTNLGVEGTEMNKTDKNFYPHSSGKKETININIWMPDDDARFGEKWSCEKSVVGGKVKFLKEAE